MIPESLSPVANHLWQSTLFAGAAGLSMLALRKNAARVRYWVWVASSLKFAVPFSLLIALGSYIPLRVASAPAQGYFAVALDGVSQPFAEPVARSKVPYPLHPPAIPLAEILIGIWAGGFMGITSSWFVRWRRIASAVRAGSPVKLDLPIRAMTSATLLEPGIFGVVHPVLLLPQGIETRLSPEELSAVISHELQHVRYRDNLITAIHMSIEAVFWFHPLLWWLGTRLMEERERACDEEVLRRGHKPRVYAESILAICKSYLASPVACLSGVTGSNLKRRIELILRNGHVAGLSIEKKLVLAIVGMAALIAPITIGALNAQDVPDWQTKAGGKMAFEVASVKPGSFRLPNFPLDAGDAFVSLSRGVAGDPPRGRFSASFPLVTYITFAYKLTLTPGQRQAMFAHLPKWVATDTFDIQARADGNPTKDQMRLMMQSLLADRFKLAVHFETREVPVFALRLAKSGKLGPNLRPHAEGPACNTPASAGVFPAACDIFGMKPRPNRRVLSGSRNTTMASLAASIPGQTAGAAGLVPGSLPGLDRPVVDQTGLSGRFDFTIEWTPESNGPPPSDGGVPPDEPGPTFLEALREQLGLQLESTRGLIQVLVIDHVERPSEN